jgi:hypothetical protein
MQVHLYRREERKKQINRGQEEMENYSHWGLAINVSAQFLHLNRSGSESATERSQK